MNNTDKARYVNCLRHEDNRGYFTETLNLSKPEFQQFGEYKQSNLSVNHEFVLRGLHYQHKNPQGKLVQVLHGAVFDFVIDLRKTSDTYLRLDIFYLSDKQRQLWVPPGYAHGFLSLKKDTIFQYHVFNNNWAKGDEYHVNPLEVYSIQKFINNVCNSDQIIISEKDKVSSKLEDAIKYE